MPSPHFKHIWRIPGRALRGAILGYLAVAAVCLPLPVSAQDPGDLAAVPVRDSQALDGGLGTAFLSHDLLPRSEERTTELPSLMRIPYDVLCWTKKNIRKQMHPTLVIVYNYT